MSLIKRQPPSRVTNTVEPAREQQTSILDKNPNSGFVSLDEAIKLLSEKQISKIVENATVLEPISPKNSTKTDYKIAHLNQREDAPPIQGVLLKIRCPEYDEGSRQNPEDILREASGLDKPAQSAFDIRADTEEGRTLLKKYYKAVADHLTFAPLSSNGIFSLTPLPGTKVRLYYFQDPRISSGEPIAGFYEKMYDDSIFDEVSSTIRNLLSKWRQKYELETTSIVQSSNSNIPELVASSPVQVSEVAAGEYGNVQNSNWPPQDLVSEFIGEPSSPDPQLYNIIIDQFDVENNPRYKVRELPNGLGASHPGPETFCNIFAADVTWAMGLPVPWLIDELGNPQPVSSRPKRNWKSLSANGMLQWLLEHGPRYEWREVSAEQSQQNANKGIVTVACIPSHIAIVRPGESRVYKSRVDPRCAQAGIKNKNNIFITNGFGEYIPRYFTCFRNTRYNTPTQEQVDRLSNYSNTSEQSLLLEQQNPEDLSEGTSLQQ